MDDTAVWTATPSFQKLGFHISGQATALFHPSSAGALARGSDLVATSHPTDRSGCRPGRRDNGNMGLSRCQGILALCALVAAGVQGQLAAPAGLTAGNAFSQTLQAGAAAPAAVSTSFSSLALALLLCIWRPPAFCARTHTLWRAHACATGVHAPARSPSDCST